MSDTKRGYVSRCWLRGRVPDRLHRLWHLRRLGRAAWHASKFMDVPCRVTHRDIERARQLIKAHQALWTKRGSDE